MTLLDQIAGAQLKVLNPSGGCHNCPRKREGFVNSTLVEGSIIWVDVSPGQNDSATDEFLSGESGKLLRKAAMAAGVPQPWSYTAVTHCTPLESDTKDAKALQCCLSQFVLDEIRDYPIVVLLGGAALSALFPGARDTHFRGNFAHHPDFPGQRFYTIWHPHYLMRRPDLMDQWRKHLERLGRYARGEEKTQAWVSTRGGGAYDLLKLACAGPVLSLDLETNGTETWRPDFKIRSFSATANGVDVVSVYEDDPAFLSCLDLLQVFLSDQSKLVIGQNIAFDVQALETVLEFRAVAQIVDIGIIYFEVAQYKMPSLKQLVAEQLDGYRYLVWRPDKEKDVDLLLKYNEEDVVHSYWLFRKGMTQLKPQTRELVLQSLCPMAMLYERASARGIYIRQDYRRAKIDEYQARRAVAVAEWRAEDPAFVPNEMESGLGLARYIFEIKGLPVISWTDKEQPSVDQPSIKQWILGGASYLRHLLTIREVDKIVGTYLEAFDKHIGPDSRIHPTHWLTSTFTSRPSSSNPNVYNMPTKSEIRDLFGAPDGSVLVESDLSQIEFRIMVCLAGDETGIEAYMRGEDAHTATARIISGNPTPTKKQRTDAKPVNFGNLYGAHWKTAQAQAFNDYGVIWTDTQSQDFQDSFFSTYKRMRPYHDYVRQEMNTNRGWFESITGHVWHYADWEHPDQDARDHAYRAYLNSKAQGPAANICYYIAAQMRRILDERGIPEAVMINSVYDSIMTEVPDPKWVEPVIHATNDAAKLAAKWIQRWFIVPLVMEHSVGTSWGSMKEVKVI